MSISSQTLTLLTFSSPSSSPNPKPSRLRAHAVPFSSSYLHFPTLAVDSLKSQPLKIDDVRPIEGDGFASGRPNEEERPGGEGKDISWIPVPRQKYISVSKAELLEGILSLFDIQEEADEFSRFASCLDSILHAEYKTILEEMRMDYSLTHSQDCNGSTCCTMERSKGTMVNGKMSDSFKSSEESKVEEKFRSAEVEHALRQQGFDLRFMLGLSVRDSHRSADGNSRIAVASRFQRAFMKLLRDAQFEELSAQDLLLASALNTDYLLTLPIYVDWKRASESNAIIFRRGYATERQKGLLIVEKLEYLQSKLLQELFFNLSRPLRKIAIWIDEGLRSFSQTREMHIWVEKVKHWLKEQSLSQSARSYFEGKFEDQMEVDRISENDLPIWLAAQKAVTRYEGFLSPVGPRGRLLRKLLTWVGFIPTSPETSFKSDSDSKTSEPYLRPNFLSRISLSDLWKPASKENCGNNIWKMFKTSLSILFSQSIIQEPAFQELILLYTEDSPSNGDAENGEFPALQLKIYDKIPIPDLPVIFPHKKLSFRILDTVRLDVASILGLLAFLVNYKFENILSSPSALLLDVIAFSALIIYVSRVILGYKQTWDRYQLLVNKTLYEKTIASGFGSVYFLLDASEQQQYKETLLAYAILLCVVDWQVSCRKSIGTACERFMYEKFNEKVEMPIDKAVDTLLRLNLVKEVLLEENFVLQVLPCSKACEVLRQRWASLID